MRRRLAPSRVAAQRAVAAGKVEVAGIPDPKPATLVDDGAAIRIVGAGEPFVSRGGEKLAAGLDAFAVPVAGRRALDVGASTGGFTDCLLQRGAAEVVALDVGYGQLAWKLQTDPRVRVVDRTNIRHADPGDLGSPFDLVVVDVSFIAVATIAPALATVGADRTDYVVLVKPQFEVGRRGVGKGGIVRDPALHAVALGRAAAALADVGLGSRGAVPSPITGAKGNREFLLWARPGPSSVGPDLWREVTQS